MAKPNITAERLRQLLHYDPETGIFTWLIDRTTIKAGEIAGTFDKSCGYIRIRADGKKYLAHRLAWLFIYGKWPKNGIDHRDGNTQNNRWNNLRDVTQSVNMQNQRKPRGKNKFLGVSPNGKRWKAHIQVHGTRIHLGTHDTPEQAQTVYLEAKRKLHEGNTL